MAVPPVTTLFFFDAAQEAAYQREHWGEVDDFDKDDSFWFWTLGHIVGKAIHDGEQTPEKLRHRLRAGAALLANWDRHVAARHGLPYEPPLMAMTRQHPPEVED